LSKLIDEIEQQFIHWEVAFFGYPLHDIAILIIVEIIVVVAYFEKAVIAEPVWLMNLKVKTD
jgi:hypothetical protein